MNDQDKQELCEEALQQFGEEAQILMVFEEMSELQKAICKYLRAKQKPIYIDRKKELIADIIEEVVDVEIMLKQVKCWLKIEEMDFSIMQLIEIEEQKWKHLQDKLNENPQFSLCKN